MTSHNKTKCDTKGNNDEIRESKFWGQNEESVKKSKQQDCPWKKTKNKNKINKKKGLAENKQGKNKKGH